MIAVGLLMPAEEIALFREMKRFRRSEFSPCALFDFAAEPIHAAFMNDVFQASVFAVGAIAEVAMNREHGLVECFQVLRRQETDDIRQARESSGIIVGHAESAAGKEVVANEFAIFSNDHVTEVVSEDVDVVQRRNDESRLEFARQIALAVKRIGIVCVL